MNDIYNLKCTNNYINDLDIFKSDLLWNNIIIYQKYYKLKISNSIKKIKYKNYTLSCDELSTLQMCKEIKRIINNGDHIFKKNNYNSKKYDYNSKKNKISKIDDYKYNDLQLTELSQIARY